MAVTNWIGGTTAVTHVMTGTITLTWANDDIITTNLWTEGGVLQQVSTTVSGFVDIENQVRDPHLVDLQNSVLSQFQQATWTSSGTGAIVATAKVSGRPLSGNAPATATGVNIIVDASTNASDGVNTWVNTTANAGPNDGYTVANWVDASNSTSRRPIDGDSIKFLPHPTDEDFANNPVSYNLTYGLDLSDITVTEVRVPKSFKGIVGDPVNKFFFKVDCTSGGSPVTVIDSNSPSVWLSGSHTDMLVVGLPRGEHALHLDGGTLATLRILGSGVVGKIHLADGSIITTLESIGAGMTVNMGTSGTVITSAYIDGGRWQIERSIATLNLHSGTIWHTTGAFATLTEIHGGQIFFNSSGTIASLKVRSGIVSFEQNVTAGITVTAASIWSGAILDKSGLKNVTYSANVVVYGGLVTSETATTQSQA